MTLGPIAFRNGDPLEDMVSDADLLQMHPDMCNNRWRNKDSYRDAFLEAYNKVTFDLGNAGLLAAYIYNTAANIVWFQRVVMYQALIMIFRDFRTERGDRWDLLIGDYQAQYDLAMKDPTLDYDTAGEAAATSTTNEKTGEVRFLR